MPAPHARGTQCATHGANPIAAARVTVTGVATPWPGSCSAQGNAPFPTDPPSILDVLKDLQFNRLETWFRRQSVARKLTATVMSVSGVTLMAACTVFADYDYLNVAVAAGPRRHDARRHRRHQQHRGADVQGRRRRRPRRCAPRRSTSTSSTRACSRATATLLATYVRPGLRLGATRCRTTPRRRTGDARAIFEEGHLRVVRPIRFQRRDHRQHRGRVRHQRRSGPGSARFAAIVGGDAVRRASGLRSACRARPRG